MTDPLAPLDAERISAYLDGELSPHERAEVQQRLTDDPEARHWAESLQALSEACDRLPAGQFRDGLTERVLAEAARRVEQGDDMPSPASRGALEPEGDFGLPFGRTSRGWVWAGVAAAAAVLISFYGRPGPPPNNPQVVANRSVARQADPLTQVALQRIKQAAPDTRLVQVTTTPQGLQALRQKLARRGIQLAVRPQQQKTHGAYQLVQQAGLAVSPGDDSAADDQLMLISADPRRVDRFVSDLQQEGKVFQVEAERTPEPGPTPGVAQPTAGSARPGVAFRVVAPAGVESAPVRKVAVPPGTVLLRVVVVRPQ